jgi:hypothetical protein
MNVTGWGILGLLMMETWCIGVHWWGNLLPRTIRLDLLSLFAAWISLGGYARKRKMGGNSQHGTEFILRGSNSDILYITKLSVVFSSPYITSYFPTHHNKEYQTFPDNSSPRTNKARAVRLFT